MNNMSGGASMPSIHITLFDHLDTIPNMIYGFLVIILIVAHFITMNIRRLNAQINELTARLEDCLQVQHAFTDLLKTIILCPSSRQNQDLVTSKIAALMCQSVAEEHVYPPSV